jgi:ERCC4-type nuclease
MSITTVIIDSREPEWVQSLRFGASLATVSALDYGDLLATTDDGVMIAVERKTVSDLLGSIKDGRIWPQLVGLRAQTPWAYLVICGAMSASASGQVVTERGETGWNWSSLQGALLKAQELGAFIVQCPGDADFEETVMTLSGRSHESTTIIEPAKEATLLTAGEQILASLPGIGVDKVARLLAYTARPCWAINFLTNSDTREHVPGIGPQTKARIRQALGLRDDEELAVVYTESGDIATRNIPNHEATDVARKVS